MRYKRLVTKLFWMSLSVFVFYNSNKMILQIKADSFELNNNLVSTLYNNGLIDSVKYSDNGYHIYLNDEDIKNVKYTRQELSEENIKLLNRMSFQDIPSTTKEYILKNKASIIGYSYAGDNLYYFKINADIPEIGASDANHSNEIEFKVNSAFSDFEIKEIKKNMKKNLRHY